MDKLIIIAGGLVAGLGLVFIGVLLGTMFGALAGWVVGLVFDQTLARVAMMLGVPGTPAWQLGAMLGFLGGFFRSHLRESSK
jgi:hypothetical protein